MVIKNENQKIDVNVKMRGGTGEAIIKHIIDNRELCHSRLRSFAVKYI
jgi:hypothetical protein